MGLVIALLGVLWILCICDVVLRWAYYLDPRGRFAGMSRMQNWGFRNIVAVIKSLRGLPGDPPVAPPRRRSRSAS